MAAAIEMASEIAEKSPVAVQGTKVNLNYARDHSVQDALEFVVRAGWIGVFWNQSYNNLSHLSQAMWNSFSMQSEDVVKAAMASMAKEKAEFSKL